MKKTDYKPHIYFCADDFGMSLPTCRRILDCRTHGVLNKISVLPNTKIENISEILKNCDGLDLSVHINLVEGQCVSDKERLPLLVDEDGHFKNSFTGLLLLSLTHRREFREQVKREIKAQIARALEFFPRGTPILLDSHQHTNMIPAIFKVLAEVIEEERLDVKYIRIPAEPVTPYLALPSFYTQYLTINLVKQIVLNTCNLINRPVRRCLNIPSAVFCGVMFSGNMSLSRVNKLLPKYVKYASKRHSNIEFLFHPGFTENGEELFDPKKTEFHVFYLSKGRKNEYDALHIIKK